MKRFRVMQADLGSGRSRRREGWRFVAALAAGLCLGTLAGGASAHGGAIEIGGGQRGPVALTLAQQQAIGLKTATAEARPLAQFLSANGSVQSVPGRQADVSSRISGQITRVYVAQGDRVRAGQRLFRVQARLVGDPPPSVDVGAPMGGVLDRFTAVLGQPIEPSTPVGHITDPSQVDVLARVFEADIGKVHVGQEVHVTTIAFGDRVFVGKVAQLGSTVDPQSRTLEVRVRLSNADLALRPNMFARALFVLRRSDAGVTVPRSAVIEANGEKCVFVREGAKFDRVEITTGLTDDRYVEVTDGLVPGDEVVTQGNREIYTQWLTGGVVKGGDTD